MNLVKLLLIFIKYELNTEQSIRVHSSVTRLLVYRRRCVFVLLAATYLYFYVIQLITTLVATAESQYSTVKPNISYRNSYESQSVSVRYHATPTHDTRYLGLLWKHDSQSGDLQSNTGAKEICRLHLAHYPWVMNWYQGPVFRVQVQT